jgi:penicillin-binding protein 1C
VLDAMLAEGMIGAAEHATALASRPLIRGAPWPLRAPHLAGLAVAESRRQGTPAPAGELRTLLDPAAQAAAEAGLEAFFDEEPEARRGLSGAVVVIEVESGAVRALAGSPDFFDRSRSGMVNCAARPRSPGSALKPFLYALAFDRGAAAPSAFLADVPVSFPDYAPENFERAFRGPVAASTALSLSLNAPAVRLQERLGTRTFLERLRELGLGTLDGEPGRYGLTLALGGGEVRLIDITNAYAALCRGGLYLPYRLFSAQPLAEGRRVFSSDAVRLVREALSSDDHLGRLAGGAPRAGEPRPAFKTGTSYGLRDAWAVAFGGGLACGVWLGDPRGKPRPELIGREAAAPLAVALWRELESSFRTSAPSGSDGDVIERRVCIVTGEPAGSFCPRERSAPFPAAAPRLPDCRVHREIVIDLAEGFELCRGCLDGRRHERRVVEEWPAEVALWFQREGAAPAGRRHHPACKRTPAAGGGPKILSPARGAEYLLLRGAPFPQRLELAAAAPGGGRLLWFLNGELVAGAAEEERVSWALQPGRHELRVVDERGRAAFTTFQVRMQRPPP